MRTDLQRKYAAGGGADPAQGTDVEGPTAVIHSYRFDLKACSPRLHESLTGVRNDLIWDNLFRLQEKDTRVWIRIPSIGNANGGELAGIAERIPPGGRIGRVEFLPYHKYGISKYQKLNISYEGDGFAEPDDVILYKACEILKRKQIPCYKNGSQL